MRFKTLIQFLIVLLISVIIGGVYYNYFLKTSSVEKNIEETVEKNIEETVEENIEETVEKNIEETVEENITNTEKKEAEVVKKNNDQVLKKKDTENINKNLNSKKSQEDNNKNILEKEKNKNVKSNKKVVKDYGNTLTEVEYLTTDRKGNKYRIFAKSAKTSKEDNDILELNEVRGIITSDKRSTIYIVSDFAEYNSSNLNSNFYQNVVINFEEKQIDCDFFDIDMQTNMAIAYGNVIVTDPKTIMKAGKITLDIQTKDINIEPEAKKKINIKTE